ncbi:hypothetical protein [Nocardia cyriacigeorgica]|uniref:DUF385 domain-containing protein n=2 Tax=Nocardia cyriacigeorgica TaxID=135487 RepID=H6RAA9_NOCCG|nr:hypothetical protein [Nocardia cyriacigeorgica]PPJ02516.1 hypothetical protein C5E43_26235 [Nocardia cyriacigeorgica]BDT87359.1 hypothetical protein FMUAM8_31230 [Nocardia cyriacigeorgica]CCF63717.1 conserved membrane protein of unknown function [Nocardia cyriacigeorgica GUH-2]
MADNGGYRTSRWSSSAALSILHCPLTCRFARGLTELRYTGHKTGRNIALPVGYTRRDDEVVVRVSRPETKTWWRNFLTPAPVALWIDGRWRRGNARVLTVRDRGYTHAQMIRSPHPRPAATTSDPLVLIDLAPGSDALDSPGAKRGKHLWRHWFTSVTVGEVVGFAAPAATAVLIGPIDTAPAAAAVLTAGVAEGLVLGGFQARVLRTAIPQLASHRWILATAVGAFIAWMAGIGLMAGNGWQNLPTTAAIPILATAALIIIFSLGVPQWFVLRDHLEDSGGWVGATAAAWVIGLSAFTAVTSPLWQPGQPRWLTLVIGFVGAVVMAAAMAAVTGAFLVWLLRAQPHERSSLAREIE